MTLTIRKIEQELLACGHHVCVLSTKSGNLDNTHMDGEHPNRTVIFLDNSIPIPFLQDPNNPNLSYHLGFALSPAVQQRIADFEPSLIHVTVPDCTCLHLIQYAREKELPLMGTYHSNIPEYMTHYQGLSWLKFVLAAFFRHQYNFMQALYVPTPFIQKHLSDSYKMDKVTNLGVWGRGIDLERFSPKHRSTKFRQKMGFEDTDVVICWVGRLVPEKRPDIFCHVIRKLHQRNIPFRALVVGAGTCEDEVKSLPNTVFAGWMSGDELAVAYASCDLFVFPSGVETFGNVTLEAAASGLPLVVEAGCSGHLVKHGITGFACHEYDPDAFFDSALCLVLDDARRKSMSEEGRKYSLNFEKRAVCKKMLDNYSKVTDEFYCKYGGHHAARDEAYQKEHSFVGGNNPRPFAFHLVECIFIILFRIMYYLAAFFLHVRERFLLPAGGASGQQATTPPSVASVNSVPVAPITTPAVPALTSITESEEGSDSDSDGREATGGSDLPTKTVTVTAIMKADDETDSTTSLSEDSASGKRTESSCCRSPETDFNITHVMAKAFVATVLFQAKMECRIRKALNDCCTPSKWNPIRRKRKNSSIAIEVDDLLLDHRSDGGDSIPEELEHMLSSSRDERLNMRRPNMVSLDV